MVVILNQNGELLCELSEIDGFYKVPNYFLSELLSVGDELKVVEVEDADDD